MSVLLISKNLYEDMPDELILHIFSMLSFEDLFAVAGTCRKFRQRAQYSFRLHPREVMFTSNMFINKRSDELHAMLQFVSP